MARQLDETILDGGIRNTHFFNGRWLTAEDLRREQEAHREHHRQLGRAIGEGVVHGLEVALADAGSGGRVPRVTVSAGLALNRRGETLALAQDEELALTRQREEVPPEAGLFAPCANPSGDLVLTGAGAYVLAACPVSGFRERAPGRELGDERSLAGCGSRYAVEGVRFRMARLPLTGNGDPVRGEIQDLLSETDAESLSLVRNLLAHLCLRSSAGAASQSRLRGGDAPAFDAAASALDDLRQSGGLGDGDVPLALLRWDNTGVRFVDRWAVRRLARWRPAAPDLSLLAADGLERLLQFLDHLRDVTRPPAQLSSLRLERLFRFVPPAAYLPVSGAGSPRGLSPSGFLQAFTTGQPDRLPAGLAAELLERSFRQPAVNLGARPVFQAFRIDENAAAVTADRSDQLYLLFASRSLDGPSSRDGVTHAFEDAWNAYRGLIRRRIFLPLGTDAEKIAAQISMIAAIRDVTDVANRQAARAAAFRLDGPAALEAFRELHGVQKDLASFLLSNIPGVPDTQSRQAFARALVGLLDDRLREGGPGLLPAIQGDDLIAAVRAQNAINLLVGTWSGEGVAVGPFGFQHLASPDGTNVVPGRVEPFRHQFVLLNNTDRRLTFQLEASAIAPSGDWQGAATIQGTTGGEISEIELPSGGRATLEVRVRAPQDAEVGETALLTLVASVPPPTDRSQEITLDLGVAAAGGQPVLRRVEFDSVIQRPTLDTNNAPLGADLTYRFNLTYTAVEGPEQASFDFTVDLTSAQQEEWLVAIEEPVPATTRRLELQSGVTKQVQVVVITARTRGSQASFTVRVDSVGLVPAIQQQHPETLNIRVAP